MTKPDYGKEDLELKAETDRIEEETDRLERSYSDMKAKYDRKVQDCARIDKRIAAAQRTRLELIKRMEQYNLHASDDAKV